VNDVIKQWIEEYKIDGFRWDLTKVYTECPTNVAEWTKKIVPVPTRSSRCFEKYADYSWDQITMLFSEHLGGNSETAMG
jgi:pullulanase/glycogen debranching enzyme